MKILSIIKIGGQVIDHPDQLAVFLQRLAQWNSPYILVHGGGKVATDLATQLNVESKLINGRRITDANSLRITTMVYAGLINKQLVAQLQALGVNACGFSGADANLIRAKKRNVGDIDYGFVGDVLPDGINTQLLQLILALDIVPVVAPITHDGKGQLLNTNADTIASALAVGLAADFQVQLIYCFDQPGVMMRLNDPDSLIRTINYAQYLELKSTEVVNAGMLPKLENCFHALQQGVSSVQLCRAEQVATTSDTNFVGTKMTLL